MFVVTVNFVVAPKFKKQFSAAMLAQAKNSVELEKDCHVFDVCVSLDDPCSVFLYEKYTDAAAFQTHLDSDHFKSFNTLVTPWVEAKTVNQWSETGACS